jgi:metal-sulfur cluster biosynthetic enzyme
VTGVAVRVRRARRWLRGWLRSCGPAGARANLATLGRLESARVDLDAEGRVCVVVRLRFVARTCALVALARELDGALSDAPDVDRVAIEMAFDRPWRVDDLSDAARLELGLL